MKTYKVMIEEENPIKNTKEIAKKNKTDKRAILKIPKELKRQIEAQKQIIELKFDYQLLEILLDYNFESFSDAEKSTYKVLINILENNDKD